MDISLAAVMDGVIMVLLLATIMFAARLSVRLQAFRSTKAEIEVLIRNLSTQIEQADRAIAGMREAAREGGRDLQERINEARALTEELQFMNETGNNLAARLEKAATSAPRAAAQSERDAVHIPAASVSASGAGRASAPRSAGFVIHDPDFALEDAADAEDEALFLAEEDESDHPASRAERELLAALQGGKGWRS